MKRNYKNLFSVFALLSSSLAFGQHFSEGFENGGSAPTGWTLTNGTDDWQFDDGTTYGPNTVNSGSYAAYFDDYNFFSGTTADLITPTIDLTSAVNPELRFWYYDGGGSDDVEVLISTDGTTYTSIYTTPTTVTPWTEIVVPIFSMAGQNSVTIAFRGTSVWGTSNPYIDDVSVVDGPTCPQPTALTVSNLSANGADIGWTTGGAMNWNIEYGPAGFTPGTGTMATNITNPFSLSMLTSNTDYDVYVQDSCGAGDVSDWSMVNFTTLPNMHSFPLMEDFEDSTLYFENEASSGTPWVLTSTLAHTGSQSAYNGYASNNVNVLHETGIIDLSTAGAPVIEFWHIAKTEGGWDECFVQISTDGGVTYNDIPSSAYRGAGTYSNHFDEDSYADWGTSSTTPDNSWWKKEVFDLQAYNVANVRFRFVLESDGSIQRDGWYIDDVHIFEPTCPSPYGITETYSNMDSIVLSWNSGYQETMWNIEYGEIGFAQGSGTMVAATDTTDTIAGLNLGTVYQFYVQADCGGGDASDWIGPYTFATPITNDSTCDAIFVAPNTDFSARVFSNIGATIQTNESGLFGNQYNTAWFKTVVPASGHLLIATCGSDFNTVVGAYAYDTIICDSMETFGQIEYNSSNFSVCGQSSRGSVEICGATPGDTVMFYVGGSNSSQSGLINLIVTDYSMDGYAGEGPQESIAACAGDTIDLWSQLSNQLTNQGDWVYPSNSSVIVDDTTANTGAFTIVGNEVYYIVTNTCDADTATVVIDVATQTNTGTAVSNFQACSNGDVFLFEGLTGSVDAGGSWTDDTGTGLLNGNKFVANGLPDGPYQFTYTVDNGVCPAASTQMTVNLVDCTNINEDEATTFGVYPNPNSGTFFITNGKNESNFVMEVVDVQGKVIFSNTYVMAAGAQQEVSLENVESGVYLIRVITNNQVFNTNMIVK